MSQVELLENCLLTTSEFEEFKEKTSRMKVPRSDSRSWIGGFMGSDAIDSAGSCGGTSITQRGVRQCIPWRHQSDICVYICLGCLSTHIWTYVSWTSSGHKIGILSKFEGHMAVHRKTRWGIQHWKTLWGTRRQCPGCDGATILVDAAKIRTLRNGHTMRYCPFLSGTCFCFAPVWLKKNIYKTSMCFYFLCSLSSAGGSVVNGVWTSVSGQTLDVLVGSHIIYSK